MYPSDNSRNSGGLRFHFDGQQAAEQALEMFDELGYQPQRLTTEPHTLRIRLEHSDLLSALEIAQEHGGEIR